MTTLTDMVEHCATCGCELEVGQIGLCDDCQEDVDTDTMPTPAPKPAFQYKPNYVAAWPNAASEVMLAEHGVTRRVHLTTFFDGFGQMSSVTPFPWDGPKTARIAAVVEWDRPGCRFLIAELEDCSWSQAINDHYHAQGVREDLPHCAHVTLDKRVSPGTAEKFQSLVGKVITFDRHGGEEDDRPPMMVEGDLMLRDWKVKRLDKDNFLVFSPPMKGGVRETYRAKRDSLAGDGFFQLAQALMSAPKSIGPDEGTLIVESVAMALLGKDCDPAPGVDWHCNRDWRVSQVREQVRLALTKAGVPGFPAPVGLGSRVQQSMACRPESVSTTQHSLT